MDEIEFEIMKETMLRVYGTVYIETNLTTGEKRVLNPKEITFIYSNNQGSHDYGRLHDFLLNMKLKLSPLKANDEVKGKAAETLFKLNRGE